MSAFDPGLAAIILVFFFHPAAVITESVFIYNFAAPVGDKSIVSF